MFVSLVGANESLDMFAVLIDTSQGNRMRLGSVLNRPSAALSQFERSTVITGASSSSSEIAISLAVTPFR